jgi:hypothetical protein
VPGRILDLASEGIAIFSPERLDPGAAISITYRGVLILAEVAYCLATGGGYRAGAKINQALATVHADLTVAEAEAELRHLTAQRWPTAALTKAAHV